MSFPIVTLGEVLQLVLDVVPVDPSASYPISGVYSFGRGLIAREPLRGTETSYKVFHRLHKDDFVLSQLKGWEGALARVSSYFDGWYLSPQFVTFRAIPDKLDIAYLEWYCKQSKVWEQLRGKAQGIGARRDTVSPDKFLALEIPLPSLSEQRHIVARIEELAARVEEARGLRRKAEEEADILSYTASKTTFGFPNKTVGDIANVTKLAGFEYTEYFTHALPGEVKVIRAGNVRNGGLDLSNAMTISEEVSDALPRSQLKPGDVVMTFIGAKIGDVTYIRNDYPRLHCGPNVAKLTPNEQILNLFLVKALQSYHVQQQIEDITKSTAQPNLSMKTIRQLRVSVPPLPEQRRIVAYLDNLQAKVDALRRLQAETSAELDALMPAVLDRAFKGEL